jgi:hypothetical protein
MQSALMAGEAGKGGGIDVLIGFLGFIEKRRYSGQSLALVLARTPLDTSEILKGAAVFVLHDVISAFCI